MQAPTPARFSSRFRLAALAAAVAFGIAVAGYFALYAEQPAPSVTYLTLSGEKLTSEQLRGKVVMVNFWATSCASCVREMPQMVETYNKYKDKGLEFVAVAMSYDPPNYVINFTETRKLPFKVALDTDGSVAQAFGDVKLTPTTFVIDKNGNLIKRYVGEPEFPALHQLLEKALAA
ncbi:MAG: hypothetical protein K0S28_1832 [Paucimonas sp.]|nr:hypothetical protein [Paucimonas sp.]